MTGTWQRLAVLLALLWPAIRYFGAERPFLVPRFPIAPTVPTWIDWLLDLPLIVAMIWIGLTVAPRRMLPLVFVIALAHTMLTAAMAWSGLPYYSDEGLWDPRLFFVSLAYWCIYLGALTLVGFLVRRMRIGHRFRPARS